MCIRDSYYTPTHEEIFNYYKAICEAVTLPIMLYNNPFTANVDMPTQLVANLTRSFEQIRYIKEASMDAARVFDIIEATDGVMNVFAGERIVESYLMGAVGYVNPYGNYIPRASSRICDMLAEGQVNEAKRIQHVIDDMQEVIKLENDVAGLLADIYGNQAEIPIDIIERMEDLINEVEEALKK